MRITTEDVIKFADALHVKVRETHPDSQVELKQSPTGHYLVIIHSDKTLQCESECYTIDPISREWIKTYGNL